MTVVYYGETKCQEMYKSGKNKGLPCRNRAYYKKDGKNLCGVHSRGNREKLPKNPEVGKIKLLNREQANKKIEDAAEANRALGKRGSVTSTKLRMMKNPAELDGYLNVFPNFRHQNRADGFGCSSLSPMSLGPIDHWMSELPPALNLENFHQFSKFYQFEVVDGKILDSAILYREDGYKDKKPHRHKFSRTTLNERCVDGNITPLFSMYYDTNGKERRYTYIQCRYFYCHYYERMASVLPDFATLVEKLNNGYNLNIVGYDGYRPTDDLFAHYLDPKRPFGHELVLYTMLSVPNPHDYPWNEYYRKYSDIYLNVI